MTIDDLDPEVCRKCKRRGKVVLSRRRPGYRYRRHVCAHCNRRWSSYQSRLNPARALRQRTRPVVAPVPVSVVPQEPTPVPAPASEPRPSLTPGRRVARSAYLSR